MLDRLAYRSYDNLAFKVLLRSITARRYILRTFEWLFLLSFVPVLFTPFISLKWHRRWLIISAVLPIIVGALHLIIEGWRIQLVPLYVLAVLIMLSRLPQMLAAENRVRRGRGIIISVVTAFILVGCVVLAAWLMPVITLPAPTGPYPVGIVDRELVDEERGRRLMVSIWYPAAERSTPALLTDHPDEVTTALGKLAGLPGVLFQQMSYVTVAASQNVPVATESTLFPVLISSHGLVGLRMQNSSTFQELASWGYVVVALDHTDAAAVTVFPDGETSVYNLAKFGVPRGIEADSAMMNEYVFPVWIADQRFVYDMVEQWAEDDPLLAGKLDLTRIGSFGHSFGGATSVEVCRVDERCRAAVDMDGGLYGETDTLPAVRPLMLMTSAESAEYTYAVDKWTSMIEHAEMPAYWLELPNSTHLSFTITQLLSPLLAPDNFDPPGGLHTIDKYLRAFFDQYLRGVETVPLGAASGETDVRWING